MSPGRTGAAFVTAALLGWSGVEAQACVHDPVIVELAIGRYASRTVPAFRCAEEALLPVTQVAELSELGVRPLGDGVLELALQPRDIRVRLDPASTDLRVGDRLVRMDPADRVVQPGEQYLSTGALRALLGVRFTVSWSDLTVALLDADSLPVGRRIARERAYAAFQADLAARTPDLAMALDRPRWDGVVLDYSAFAPSADPLAGSYSSRLGLNVLGGALEAGVASTGQPGEGNFRFDGAWTGVWRGNPRLAQLRLGDGLSTGPRPRTLRGVSLSNGPYFRPALFGSVPFQGGLGPGWEIEAYRGGRLIALDSADAFGRFSLDLPVEYGENPVDLVAYGPFGEIREFNQTYRVVSEAIPARRLEYGVSLGGCRAADCRANGNLDLRYGLSRRWTIRGGIDRFWRDSLPSLSHPYLSLAGAVGNAWALELEAVGGAVLRGAARYEPSRDLRVTTEVNRFARGTVQPILTPDGREAQWTTEVVARPFRAREDLYVEASFDRITATTGSTTSGRAGLSLYAAHLRLAPAVRFTRFTNPSEVGSVERFVSLNMFSLPVPQLGRFLGQVTGRGVWEMSTAGGTTTMAAYLARPIGRALHVEVGGGWQRGAGSTLSLLLSTQLPSLRATTSVTVPSEGPALATQFVQGSLLYDPASRRVGFVNGPAVERAGVSGRVFLDLNGDGRWQPGEDLLAGVRVRAGYVSAVSDSAGRYRVWDLAAFEPALVAVDTSTLASPLWVPAHGLVSIEAAPNRFRALDIPIVPGGVVEGRLVRTTPTGDVPVPGARLVMRREGSRDVLPLATFSDGGFYVLGVKPGDYELSVEGASLRFTMPALPDGAAVEGLELRLP